MYGGGDFISKIGKWAKKIERARKKGRGYYEELGDLASAIAPGLASGSAFDVGFGFGERAPRRRHRKSSYKRYPKRKRASKRYGSPRVIIIR